MTLTAEQKRRARYEQARLWLDKHGTAHRSNMDGGYLVIASAHGLSAQGGVQFTGDDDETADYENAFTDAVEQLRTKLGPLGKP